jgi:TolA-binding protein
MQGSTAASAGLGKAAEKQTASGLYQQMTTMVSMHLQVSFSRLQLPSSARWHQERHQLTTMNATDRPRLTTIHHLH